MELDNSFHEDLKNQMSLISETNEVIRFLEFLGKKSILNQSTVHCRMTACNHFFEILEDHENNMDYLLENLNILMHRFRNKNPNVSKDTLRVYKSRIKGSLEDYRDWCRDPLAWERNLNQKANAYLLKKKNSKKPIKENFETPKKEAAATSATTEAETETQQKQTGSRKVSFPIRPDFEIQMSIPIDGITRKELQKIGLFLYPYCKDIDLETNFLKLPH
jgi:hypothetical protein